MAEHDPFTGNLPEEDMPLSIFEQTEAAVAEQQAEAERQAVVNAAHAEALESGRLSQQEKEFYRGIARAANTAQLPEGVKEEDRLSTLPFRSTPKQAAANLDALREEARDKLRADRADRKAEDRAIQNRQKREEAERVAAKAAADKAEADRIAAEETAAEQKRQAEEAARKTKLDAEAERVRNEVRAQKATKPEDVDAEVDRIIAEKHSSLSEQARGIMRHGLRERVVAEANARTETEAEEAAQRRISHIEANGGADEIENIRAREEAQTREQAEELLRRAFKHRLHNRMTPAERRAMEENEAEVRAKFLGESKAAEAPQEPEGSRFLSAAERAQLNAIVAARDSSELPADMNSDDRLSTVAVRVGRAQAERNLNEVRARAQERLNENEDNLRGLLDRAREHGVHDFTDEEIAALPATVNEFMSDDAVNEYLQRMQQIRGAEPRTDGRADRNIQPQLVFGGGTASELSTELQEEVNAHFAIIRELRHTNEQAYNEALANMSEAERNAYYDYNFAQARAEVAAAAGRANNDPDFGFDMPFNVAEAPSAPAPAGNTGERNGNTADDDTVVLPPVPPLPPLPPARRRPLRPGRTPSFGGDVPSHIQPGVPASGVGEGDVPFEPQIPLSPRAQRELERSQMSAPARAWDTAKRWWPGVSRVSHENDRPQALAKVGDVVTAGPVRRRLAARRERLERERAANPAPEARYDDFDDDPDELPAAPVRQPRRRPAPVGASTRRPAGNSIDDL